MKKDKLLKKLVQQAVQASSVQGKVSSVKVRIFISEFKKLPQGKAIFCLSEYRNGLERVRDMQTLKIESAIPLPRSTIRKIQNEFKKFHTVTEIQTKQNSSLLGGLKVTIGDQVFDDSIERKVQKLGDAIYA